MTNLGDDHLIQCLGGPLFNWSSMAFEANGSAPQIPLYTACESVDGALLLSSLRIPTSHLNRRNHSVLSAAVWFQGSSLQSVKDDNYGLQGFYVAYSSYKM